MGERLTFLSSVGFLVLATFILGLLFKYKWVQREKLSLPRMFSAALLFIIVLFSVLSIARNNKWEDQLTLMRSDISHLEKSAKANNLLATYLVLESKKKSKTSEKRKLYQEAEKLFSNAVEVYPDYFNAWYDLAWARIFLGKKKKALEAYTRALQLDSTFAETSMETAILADELNEHRIAIKNYQRVIQLQPKKIEAYTSLSFVYFKLKDYETSINVNLLRIKRNPDAIEPQVNIGKTLRHVGETKAAIEFMENAWQLDMTNQVLLADLVAALRETGEDEKADYYQKFALK